MEADHAVLLQQFETATTKEKLTESEAALATAITTWGKKKGALLSCKLVDDADRLVTMIAHAASLRKLIGLFHAYYDSPKPTTAQAFSHYLADFSKGHVSFKKHNHNLKFV